MPLDRIDPRGHQIEAHEALTAELAVSDRAQVSMACGSGKTFTQAFLARDSIEAGGDGSVIVCLVPNRELAYQNAANFNRVFGDDVEYLAVCTPLEAREPLDEDAVPDEDRAFRSSLTLSTDEEEIRRLMRERKSPTVIFSTYQSAKTMRGGLTREDGTQTDIRLALFDEAHRTAGEKDRDSLFAYALFDENIKIGKRAFFTATPRIAANESNGDVISMGNPEIYGRRVYEYTFSRGISEGRLVDYDLWVPVISSRELTRHMQDSGLDPDKAREALAELALRKVMEKTGQSRFVTYHGLTRKSEAFAERLEKVLDGQGFTIGHVDGKTPGLERRRLQAALAEGKGIVTNCKALVEGVDSPGLQGVMFVDAKSSLVDVVQAVGRVSRPDERDPGKRGSVIAPIVLDSIEPEEVARQAKDQGFATLIQVANALRASDDTLSQQIRDTSRNLGRTGSIGETRLKGLKVLTIDGEDNEATIAGLEETISMMSLSVIRDGFSESVGSLERYISTHGRMPGTKDDPRLYAWSNNVRRDHAAGRLDPENATIIESIDGWEWAGKRATEVDVAAHISAFRARHQRVPDPRSGSSAEAALGQALDVAERRAAWAGVRPSSMTGREEALADALDDQGHLFRQRVPGNNAVRGTIRQSRDPRTAETIHIFHPEPGASPRMKLFETGREGRKQPIRLHLGPEEAERVAALPQSHVVTLTLRRAGRRDSFREDGAIREWHAVEGSRGDQPPPKTLKFLLHRLADMKALGHAAPRLGALTSDALDIQAPAPSIDQNALPATLGDIIQLSDAVRRKQIKGSLSESLAREMDKSPGFTWVDPDRPEGRLASAVGGLVARHGADVLKSPEARMGDSGLANTLRDVDSIVGARDAWGAEMRLEARAIPKKEMLLLLAYGQHAAAASAGAGRANIQVRRKKDEEQDR